MEHLVVENGKAIYLSKDEAGLFQSINEIEKKEEQIYNDVSDSLNIANSKLGYMLPKATGTVQDVQWQDVNYNALDSYNKEMDILQEQFNKLKEGKKSGKYTEAYLNEELNKIHASASNYLAITKLDIETMKDASFNRPVVKEKSSYGLNAQEVALNKANTIAIIQSILSTNDLDKINALLEDNISNNEVRLLVGNYLSNQATTKQTVQMALGIKQYEDKLKNKEQLASIQIKYEKIDKTISNAVSRGYNVYPKFMIDETSFLKEVYDFSKRALNKL